MSAGITESARKPEGRLRLTPEIALVPSPGAPLIYAPIKGRLLRADPRLTDRILAARTTTEALDLVDPVLAQVAEALGLTDPLENPTRMPSRPIPDTFQPTGVILLVTARCNLRCRYCYADAGDHSPTQFPHQVAEAAIRFAVDNALALGEDRVHLSFHGGGEPTLDMALVRHCVEFARTTCRDRAGRGLQVVSGMVTNGYVSKATADWIAENMESVQVSLDGPRAVQDRQRPVQNGTGSHQRVVDTILRLQGRVPDLLIKSTISTSSVSVMAEIAEFMCTTFEIPRFHFGPVLSAGRGISEEFGQPGATDFFKGYLAAQEVADRYGRTIVVSGAQAAFPKLRETYCGVTDPNFAVNMNGSVTSCYEIIYEDDPNAHQYHYGNYDPVADAFVFDHDRIRAKQAGDVKSFPKCANCFAKLHCAGDCHVRWITGPQDDVAGDVRCELNRLLIAHELHKLLDNP